MQPIDVIPTQNTGNTATLIATDTRKIDLIIREPEWTAEEEKEFSAGLRHLLKVSSVDEIRIVIKRDRP